MSVTATVLAAGMATLIVVIPLAGAQASWRDTVLLAGAATTHTVAALTVGRRWEPGGRACAVYLLMVLVLVGGGVAVSVAPESDAFWFLLVPIGLSAMTMRRAQHAVISVFGLGVYAGASVIGPGFDVEWAVPRIFAGVIFAVAMAGLAHRLQQALVAVDQARAELEAQNVELAQANERLGELDRAKDAFVATVSHELRTPLTTVIGAAETLYRGWDQLDDEHRRILVDQVARNARGIQSITTTMLDMARIERGGFRPARERVDVAALVDDSILRLQQPLQDHLVKVEIAEQTFAASDPGLLARVIDNLLLNAARHTPSGTSVHVRAVVAADGVRIEVADDGPGMEPAQLARLGEWFYRGDAQPTGSSEGIGIGLALVGEVLAALGSSLDVASTPGQGTTFSFLLAGHA